jgi:LPS O-antigen subunit length determinant protein (WzzB/FepE family)
MIDILIVVFIILTIGFVLGWKLREVYATRIVNQLFSNHEEQLSSNIMNVHMEVDRGQFYIYDSATNAFITQVKTKEEMFEFFNKTYPDKTVMMKRQDLELFDLS